MTLGWLDDQGLFHYLEGHQVRTVAAATAIELDPRPDPMIAWNWLLDDDYSMAIRDGDSSQTVTPVRQLTYQAASDSWSIGRTRVSAAIREVAHVWLGVRDPEEPGAGVTDGEARALADSLTSAVKNRQIKAYVVGESLVFYHPQDISDWTVRWVTERRAREAARKQIKEAQGEELRHQQEQEYWEATRRDGFVNPYNFVPIPDGRLVDEQRQRPAGHDRQYAHLHTGVLRFEAAAVTPLALADAIETATNGEPTIVPRQLEDGRIDIWGSGLKGSLRSAYEVLTGSCLRVLVDDALGHTVYRDPAKARPPQWKLGIVAEVDTDGLPTDVAVCPEFVWVPVNDLSPHAPETGNRFDLVGGTRRTVADRTVLEGATVTPTNDRSRPAWVVLVTDLAARGNERNRDDEVVQTWYWVMGKEGGPRRPVTDLARQRFETEVGGTRASVRQNGGATLSATTLVNRGKQGRFRTPLRGSLTRNTPVWCELTGDSVSRLALSYLWRTWREGIPSVLDRLGSARQSGSPLGNAACQDPEQLCPACRAFGSAGVRASGQSRTGRSEQDSYRGQVRPVVMRSDRRVELSDPEKLAVMGEPRPGSGQNYFRLSTARSNAERRGDRPLRELGGKADVQSGSRRGARPNGTKRWWMTSELPNGRQRWMRLTGGQGEGNMNRSARLIPATTQFSGTLAFVNLSDMELGALIAALDPGRLPGAVGNHGWHLGGGKPIGLGVMRTTSIEIETWSAAQRYLGEDGARTLWTVEQTEAAVAALADRTPHGIRTDVWPAFLNLTQIDRVPGEVVTFPMKWGGEFTRPTNPAGYRAGQANPGYSTVTAGTSVPREFLVLLPAATDPALAQHLDGSGAIKRAE